MQLVMTKRAVQERSAARSKAYQRHEEVEESVQSRLNGESVSSRLPSTSQLPSSQPPSFVPGQPPSFTPGSQPPSYTPGANPFRDRSASFSRASSQKAMRVNP